MPTDSLINGIPMTLNLNQFTILVASLKYKVMYLSDLVHPQTGYHFALFIALCQWLLCILPLYIDLLECSTGGYCAVHYTDLLLPQTGT